MMSNYLIFAILFPRLWDADIWYSLPLIIAVSLVYSATRHETIWLILKHACRLGLWIVAFMAFFSGLLWLLS